MDDLHATLRSLIGERHAPRDLTLLKAVSEGRITSLRCEMERCLCPEGRDHFESVLAQARGPWAPSADRWPVPGRDGGEYALDNVRLAHFRCNSSAGGHAVVAIRKANGQYQSEAHRENSRRNGRLTGPRVAAARVEAGWYQSEQWRDASARGRATQVETRRATGFYQSPEWLEQTEKARAAHRAKQIAARRERLAQGGRMTAMLNNCKRWQIDRGKPCVCGRHP